MRIKDKKIAMSCNYIFFFVILRKFAHCNPKTNKIKWNNGKKNKTKKIETKLNEEISKNESKKTSLSEECEKVEKEASGVREELTKLQKTNDTLKDECDDLQSQLSNLKKQWEEQKEEQAMKEAAAKAAEEKPHSPILGNKGKESYQQGLPSDDIPLTDTKKETGENTKCGCQIL